MPTNLEIQYPACRLTRVIGLFIARLLAYLLHLQASGRATVPPDIAYMVASADLMVHDLICYLAERRLHAAGYRCEAEVLRATGTHRPVCAPSATTSPTELIARIEATRAKFEQAETLSEHLARLVVCAFCLLYVAKTTRTIPARVKAEHPSRLLAFKGRSPEPWPPPTSIALTPLAA